jgi:hypothetical protein
MRKLRPCDLSVPLTASLGQAAMAAPRAFLPHGDTGDRLMQERCPHH